MGSPGLGRVTFRLPQPNQSEGDGVASDQTHAISLRRDAKISAVRQSARFPTPCSLSDAEEDTASAQPRVPVALPPLAAAAQTPVRIRHLCDCRPGWEAKARPRVRSSTHSSQRLVSATCQPLQWSRSSAENSSPRARPPDYDESSARRDHQASAAVIALSASWMPSPTSPAVAAQCKGTRARAPGSQRCSSRVSGSGAVPS